MPRWKTTVNLGDLHAAHRAKQMTIQDVGKELARRLRANRYAEDIELECLGVIGELEQGVDDAEQYDDILDCLYNFGDDGHRIWFDSSSDPSSDDTEDGDNATQDKAS